MNSELISRQLRLATLEDHVGVYDLLLESREQIGLAVRFKNQEYLQWVADECVKNNVWVVTTADEGIVGAMVLDGDELAYLVVAPGCRKHGVGTQLIEHAKALRPELTAEVLTTNEPMQKLLGDRGFNPSARRKSHNMDSYIWHPLVE